jgi:hypothetical protein
MAKKATVFLTRDQIDEVIAGLTAGDLIEAMGDGDTIKGTRMIGIAFDSAAARLGISNGTQGTHMVSVSDFKYLADKLGGAVNTDSPLSEGQEP